MLVEAASAEGGLGGGERGDAGGVCEEEHAVQCAGDGGVGGEPGEVPWGLSAGRGGVDEEPDEMGSGAEVGSAWTIAPADRQGGACEVVGRDGVRRSQYQQHVAMAVLALLHGTGLRRGELERLDLEDWKREEGVLVIDGRKTGRERAVPVSEGMWRCVEAYLPRRHNLLEKVGRLEEKALLVSQKGTRMQGIGVALMLRRLAVAAGIGRVTPHQFRHTCASDLLESGVSLPAVKEVLGHACVTTTVRYLQVTRCRGARKRP
jgi:hypothetical protein